MKDNPEPLTSMRRGGVALVLGLIMLTSMLANMNLEPESYLQLEENEKETISKTIKGIIENLNEQDKKKILIIIPNNAKIHLKI